MRLALKPGVVLLFIFVLTSLRANVYSQSVKHDTSYYREFPGLLTGRYYFSRKHTDLNLIDKSGLMPTLKYRPNTPLNMGVGGSYGPLNLNLAFSFGFLNRGRGDEVDSDYLDMQVHVYPQKLAIDGFLQFYEGYQLLPQGKFAPEGEAYHKRKDVKVRKVGASVKYVFNFDRFSYRAAFFQTEWQKRSAGTPLLGFDAYGGTIKGDSSLIPRQIEIAPDRDFDQLNFFELGPNIGYAYNLVIAKHFFLMGSASGNLGFGFTQAKGGSREINWGVNANYFLKGSVGYNSERWAVNANYVYNNVRPTKVKDFSSEVGTGNYRLNFIYRFVPGPKLKRTLDELSVNSL
ncbi:hypothetical protein GCM10028791_34230 [Echinicola sediminis]